MTTRELMTRAIVFAEEAAAAGEVPVGALVSRGGEIVAAARNRVEELKDPLAHAEMLAIRAACAALDTKFLTDCDLFVTLEPCPMCSGAIINSRIKRVVFGAFDPKAGSLFTVQEMCRLPYNHKPEIQAGFMERECSELLKDFFAQIRKRGPDRA